MKTTINCFLPHAEPAQVKATVEGLKKSPLVTKIFLLATGENCEAVEGCEVIKTDGLNTSETMKKIAGAADAEYILLSTKYNNLVMGYFALDRFVKFAQVSKYCMIYADSYPVVDG